MLMDKKAVKELVQGIKRDRTKLRQYLYKFHQEKGYRLFPSKKDPSKRMSFSEFIDLRLGGQLSLSSANKEIKAAAIEVALGGDIGVHNTACLMLLATVAGEDRAAGYAEAMRGLKKLSVASVERVLVELGYRDEGAKKYRKRGQNLPSPSQLTALVREQYVDAEIQLLVELLGQLLVEQDELEHDGW